MSLPNSSHEMFVALQIGRRRIEVLRLARGRARRGDFPQSLRCRKTTRSTPLLVSNARIRYSSEGKALPETVNRLRPAPQREDIVFQAIFFCRNDGAGKTSHSRHDRPARTQRGVHPESRRWTGDRLNHLPPELSGGEQQRVAIARALTNDPDIIFADEPTGNLDSKTGDGIMDLLLGLAQDRRKTLVVVTHDNNLAQRGDRTLRIVDGLLAA